jgi:hypothetical protein
MRRVKEWKVTFNLHWFLLLIVAVLFGALWLPSTAASGKEPAPYVPQVIPVPQDHAWCYVLVNTQSKVVGDIHILSCIPKLGE